MAEKSAFDTIKSPEECEKKHSITGLQYPVICFVPEQDMTVEAERFLEVDFLRQDRFKVPADFDVHRFFDGAFGLHHGRGDRIKVVVDFDEDVRPLLAGRQWHDSQKITAGPEGKVRLQLEVSDLTEVTTWVLGWGHRAVVIEPKALREAVSGEVTAAARAYC